MLPADKRRHESWSHSQLVDVHLDIGALSWGCKNLKQTSPLYQFNVEMYLKSLMTHHIMIVPLSYAITSMGLKLF